MKRISQALSVLVLAAATFVSACAPTTMSSNSGMSALTITPPSPDPRVGLRGGLTDAAEAIWNMRLLSHSASPQPFYGITNSDLAFTGKTVIQGNYNGFQIWDITNPSRPVLQVGNLCPASQSDVSVVGKLLFVSAEAPSARLDCGTVAPSEPVSKDRIRGVRIFDITNISKPKYIANVQTCRGSHTHTVLTDPKDKENVYIYISGTSSVRSPEELAGCIADPNDPNTAMFRIEVIKVPLAHPEQAAIVSSPRIFAEAGVMGGLVPPRGHGAPPMTSEDSARARTTAAVAAIPALTATSTPADTAAYMGKLDALRAAGYVNVPTTPPRGRGAGARGAGAGAAGAAGRAGAAPPANAAAAAAAAANARPRGLTQCHDITVYPAVGLAGGACAGMGLLLDIKDPAHPRRIDAVADSNFSFWHSATFSNDGSKVLFSDEWGGGSAAYCRATDPRQWGANSLFSIEGGKMKHKSYYKIPAPQTSRENCVSHNGSLIPIPGREVMVQAFYQGGITVFDWTDPSHPVEIGFFDRGPNDPDRLVSGGYWSAYWYNGLIIGSEEKRGLDIFELTPSPAISQNEIDAAKLVVMDEFNAQNQVQFKWPAHIAVVRSYLDQLQRGNGMDPERVTATSQALDRAMQLSGAARANALDNIGGTLESQAKSARDGARVRTMAAAVRALATASRR